jgi:hypothetical protein
MSTAIQNPTSPAAPTSGNAPLSAPTVTSDQAQYPGSAKATDLAGVPIVSLLYSEGASLSDNLTRLNAAAPEVQQAVSVALAGLPPDHSLKKVLDGLSADCLKSIAKVGSKLSLGIANPLGSSDELKAALTVWREHTDGTAAKEILATGQKTLDLLQEQPPNPAQISSTLAELKTAAASEDPTQAALAGILYSTLGFMDSANRTLADLNCFQEMMVSLRPLMEMISKLKIADSRSAQMAQAAQFSLMTILSEMIVRQMEIQTQRAEQDNESVETQRQAETEKSLQSKIREDRAENKEIEAQAAVAYLKSLALASSEAERFLNALVLARQVESGRMPQA